MGHENGISNQPPGGVDAAGGGTTLGGALVYSFSRWSPNGVQRSIYVRIHFPCDIPQLTPQVHCLWDKITSTFWDAVRLPGFRLRASFHWV